MLGSSIKKTVNQNLVIYISAVLFATGLALYFQDFKLALFTPIISSIFALLYQPINHLKHKPLLLMTIFLALFLITAAFSHSLYSAAAAILLFCFVFIFINSFRILTSKTIDSIFYSIISILFLSFLPYKIAQTLTALMLVALIIFLFAHKKDLADLVKTDLFSISNMSTLDILLWISLFFYIVFFTYEFKGTLLGIEFLHPMYENSIGHSFIHKLFPPPDLSYLGKTIKFHFLSTRLPDFFELIFNINVIESVYFITPLFLLTIFFTQLNAFFYEYPKLKISMFFLFFMPIFAFGPRLECTFLRTILYTPSYVLAFIFILIALHYLIKENYTYLVLSTSMLILTKASFFVTMLGCITLFFVRTKSIKKLFIICGTLTIIFLIINILFLSGAHQHNLWILYPPFLLYKAYSYGITFKLSLAIRLIITVSGMYFFIKYNNDKGMLAISALALSGLLGNLFISEMAEQNCLQFYVAAYIVSAMVTWYFIDKCTNKIPIQLQILIYSVMYGFVVYSASHQYIKPINMRINKNAHGTAINLNIIKAYSWLDKNSNPKSVILFPNFYDNITFNRSGSCKRQMFCEGSHFKGISMEPDFPKRCAEILSFYKNNVELSSESQKAISYFFAKDYGLKPGLPLSLSEGSHLGLSYKLLHKLSGGKEWFLFNKLENLPFEIRQNLDKLNFDEASSINFLKNYGITHIVLENGDQPSQFLSSITQKIYAHDEITILKINFR